MHCPVCDTDNVIGASYCAGCGQRLQVTTEQAQREALASVRHDNWQRICKALGRTLFLFSLVFVGSLLFNAYARREVIAEFSASAPLPRQAPFDPSTSFTYAPEVPAPKLGIIKTILVPEQKSADAIVTGLANSARERMACIVVERSTRVIRGTLLYRDDDYIYIITGWPPRARVRAIKAAGVDFKSSKLPE